MIYAFGGDTVLYLETGSVDPAYNLAFEEYILQNYRQGDILILWQNANAVIVGRNQNADAEINRAFVEENGIKVVRRNTGGGAVFHDLGNLNYSFITDASGLEKDTLRRFLDPVVAALRSMGLDAESSGRNDILVSGKKVSGTAQQLSKGRILHHGTLLFDADTGLLAGALNPDPTKYQSKGIASVRSRVGNIRQQLPADMDLPQFWNAIKKALTSEGIEEIHLQSNEIAAIHALKAEKYDTWQWNFGKSPKFQLQNRRRFPGGLLDIHLSVQTGLISEIKIYGDFLALLPVADLEEVIEGCAYEESALLTSLAGIDLAPYLGGITLQELVETICNK